MIPNGEYEEAYGEEEDAETDFEVEADPSLTYAMRLLDAEENKFVGRVNEEHAIRQAILKILNTERYEYEIYSWDYGIELKDLYGMPMAYCMSEVKDRITEALLADDRIREVGMFTVKQIGKRNLHVSFVVTLERDGRKIEMESGVNV